MHVDQWTHQAVLLCWAEWKPHFATKEAAEREWDNRPWASTLQRVPGVLWVITEDVRYPQGPENPYIWYDGEVPGLSSCCPGGWPCWTCQGEHGVGMIYMGDVGWYITCDMHATGTQGAAADHCSALSAWDKRHAQRWPHEVSKWCMVDDELRDRVNEHFEVHEQWGCFVTNFTQVAARPLCDDLVPRVGRLARIVAPPKLASEELRQRLQAVGHDLGYEVLSVQHARFELHNAQHDITITCMPSELVTTEAELITPCVSRMQEIPEEPEVAEETGARAWMRSALRRPPRGDAEVGWRVDVLDNCLYKTFSAFLRTHGQVSADYAREQWDKAPEVRFVPGRGLFTFEWFCDTFGAEAEECWDAAGPMTLRDT